MVVLLSNWSDVQSVPERYIFPSDVRPGNLDFPTYTDIPVIDLGNPDKNETIQQILKACQDSGIFQVINHGVSEDLMDETMNVLEEFFNLPGEYKERFYSQDITKPCRIFSSTLAYETEEFHYWRDNFTHRCHPLEDNIHSWPENPTKYRSVVSKYSVETRMLLLRILNMISQGLGIEPGYFEGELSKTHLFSVNHHIPCPDPSLTLGMPVHADPNLITLLHQGHVPGLQLLKDGRWTEVAPLRNAFIILPGLTLKVVSNDRFNTAIHRVVTNSKQTRTTIGVFLGPSQEISIEPAGALVDSGEAPVYRGFTYPELFNVFKVNHCDALRCFKTDSN
ncbi:hyoscyamine 6-dioxygenase-like [Ipomoea triloba]|uniref:hyoscyamine 6-dioxygenase-like n=1 Tax=Ipomoea triloba TaxID=35885 RepID=UPI00125DE060|nr:hyoscyamine 6-dioxygenase-like [Ipomoea triloba]